MAGPNRPDENPKDFSFLNTDLPATGQPSFPTFDDAPANSLPNINFDSSPVAAPNPSGVAAEPISFPSPASDVNSPPQRIEISTDAASTTDSVKLQSKLPDHAEEISVPESTPAAFLAATEVGSVSQTSPVSNVRSAEKRPASKQVQTPAPETKTPEATAPEQVSPATPRKKTSSAVNGYAIAITLLMIYCLMTGRLKLFGNAALESLPDIRPLDSNEFRKVPDGTPVPEGHVLKLGESRRFGDVVLTPVKVTREPLFFEQFQTKAPATTLTTDPVLKLWLRFENRSGYYAFPPFDSGLMSHRTPKFSTDESTIVNSMLSVSLAGEQSPKRILNFLQTMDNAFVIVGQQSGKVILPEETMETFVACSEDIQYITPKDDNGYTWRVQFRKGVNYSSGHGVTTLVDVMFTEAEITEPTPTPTAAPAAG